MRDVRRDDQEEPTKATCRLNSCGMIPWGREAQVTLFSGAGVDRSPHSVHSRPVTCQRVKGIRRESTGRHPPQL